VVHLLRLTGLNEGVGLVYDKDQSRVHPTCTLGATPLGMQVGEGVADEGGHLTGQAAAAGSELEPVKEDGQIELVGEVAAERLGERGLAGADVTGENKQRGGRRTA
jgi:hypothetical protein